MQDYQRHGEKLEMVNLKVIGTDKRTWLSPRSSKADMLAKSSSGRAATANCGPGLLGAKPD